MLVAARAVAVTLIAILSAGSLGVCAGWQDTPEARMACCAEGSACPMHTSEDESVASTRVVTQAEADSCCAAGERDDASPTAKPLGAVVAIAVRLPILFAPPVHARTSLALGSVRDRAHAVPRHLLLSVFLI